MLSCQQIPRLLLRTLHNFRVPRTTEHSDIDRLVHLVVQFPSLDLSSSALSQIVLRRALLDNSLLNFQSKLISLE